MAREFAKMFYRSKAWKMCRESYIRKMPRPKRGLCEECYKHGKHVLGKELHHKIFLTEKNINDKTITLNHDNLIFLCYDCHQKIHNRKGKNQSYSFDEYGNVVKK
jgi:5-methylcytosine-specific restriction endonuclease McrA